MDKVELKDDVDDGDTAYDPEEEYRTSKRDEILQKQESETVRYKQLLTLMQKSDLFVKMIFKRMEDSKQKAEDRIERLSAPSRKRKRPLSVTSTTKRQKVSRYSVIEQEDIKVEADSDHDEDSSPTLFTGGYLRDYQIEGQKWLNNLYQNGISGILADEMGLGKTVQVIAAIAKMIENGVKGPFMVIAPLSTLPNWANEFQRFTPEIPIVLYHALKIDRPALRSLMSECHHLSGKLSSYPVLITSYQIILNDATHLRHHNWKMLCVDEGHRLKNHNCMLLKSLKKIDSGHRLLLTGTPLQNDLSELWSLLNFILPEIFNDLRTFEEWFDCTSLSEENSRKKVIAQEKEKRILGLMHQILTPFMLRRLKSDVDLTIPPKREVILYAPLTEYQKTLYDKALDGSIRQITKPEDDDKKEAIPLSRAQRCARVTADYSQLDGDDPEDEETFLNSMENFVVKGAEKPAPKIVVPKYEFHVKLNNVLMILRRITNHGHMVEYPLDEDGEYCFDNRLIDHSGKIQVLDRLLKLLRAGGHKVLLFSQFTSMLDIIQDYCNYMGYKYSRLDGSFSLEDRKLQMQWFAEEEDIFIFLISTRAGGLGLNLVSADTVIFFDSDWNPQQDIQAQDRCHRIGQTKPVLIFRLLIPNTVEEKIYRYASNKRTLERLIIHGHLFKKSLKSRDQWDDKKKFEMSDDELWNILSSREYQTSVSMKVLDDAILKKHIDRSDLWSEWNATKEENIENVKEESG